MPTPAPYRTYRVLPRDREPLIQWMLDALRLSGCRIINSTPPTEAPFRISFEMPSGERRGIVAYAFLANNREIKNRPADEHRFQVKYGSGFHSVHEIWQDEFGLYTTLFLGINPRPEGHLVGKEGFFVAADPMLHQSTRFSKSIEFKDEHADRILASGWRAWERERRPGKRRAQDDEGPIQVLVGGTARNFLRYVLFERESLGEDQGHRQLLAERLVQPFDDASSMNLLPGPLPNPERLHALASEFELSEGEVMSLIASAPRLKMAVRGWVAEEHLLRSVRDLPGVTEAERLNKEGSPDVSLRFEGSAPLRIECKNVLRQRDQAGRARLDFQRTRASLGDPCSRYYSPSDFDVVAACLHAVTEKWEFRFADPLGLDRHARCVGKLTNLVRVDERWQADAVAVLRAIVKR